MSTNQAFIKAFRRDPPRTVAPPPLQVQPARARQAVAAATTSAPISAPASVSLAALATSVEIVAPAFHWPQQPIVDAPVISHPPVATQPMVAHSPQPIIGKWPLSSFAPEPILEPIDPCLSFAEPTFNPETTISAFRWPQVCRALWDRFADQYEHIAELLIARSGRDPGRGDVIGVGSLHAGDGATTTLLCLAVALAAQKRSVILVDANFRAPRLAGLLGVQPTTSWQDVLEHGLPVAEAVIRAEHDGVDLLPLDLRAPTDREPNGARLAMGLQTSITAGVLRYAYEVVLVDLGAILAPRSFATVSHLIRNMRIESAVAVSDPKHAEADDLTIAGELLDETGCQLLGLIENRTNSAP